MLVSFLRWFIFIYLAACSTFLLLNYFSSTIPHNFNHLDYDLILGNHDVQTKIPLFPEDSLQTDRILEQMNYVPKNLKQTPIIIRLLPSLPTFGVKYGKTEFNRSACLVQNCFLVRNDPQNRADAIVFFEKVTLSRKLKSEQIWILYQLESPEIAKAIDYTSFSNLINWTASYRWDSDLVTPYERFTPWDQIPKDQLPKQWPKIDQHRNYAKGKQKQVAWFVSNCETSNMREQYVKELSRHISVHTYGLCGEYSCPKRVQYCSKFLNEDYKFYLAFENSNCDDYVTEKFFVNGLQHDIIPVVMGAPKSHYIRISPPHSFIHIDDFSHPSDLAQYLHYLDKNDTAYNQYFKWKGTGQFINAKFWCRLCALLNDPRQKIYENLEEWWRTGKCRTAI